MDYIEGGWPGSNDKDAELFRRAASLPWCKAKLAAFGSTGHPKNPPEEDANPNALLETATAVVTIFGKSWDLHVSTALMVPLPRNCELIRALVAYLKSRGYEVIYDAEHSFDGFAANSVYALVHAARGPGGGRWHDRAL